MLTVLLIRTGSTEYECQGRVQGTLDVPLSEDGRQQIEQVAEHLSDRTIDALYAGPCRATQQSAEILAEKLHLKTKTIEKLGNLNLGLWQGMLVDDVKRKQPKVYRQWQDFPETVCPPDGETLQATQERLRKAFAKIAKKHKSGTIAIVVPEPLASVFLNVVRNDALGDLWKTDGEKHVPWETIEISTEVASH